MAAYNGERFIAEQIESILCQEYVSVTLFVSVDFSSDSTLEIVNAYSRENKNIVALPYGAKYGSAAQNFFRLIRDVNVEEFDYFSLSDQDDIWDSKKINEAVQTLRKSRCNAYSSNVLAFWDGGRTRLIEKAQPFRQWDYLFESAGPGCSYVLDKNLVQKLKAVLLLKFEQTQKVALHDWFIYAFARTHGYRWIIDSRSFILYRQHGGNVIGANNGLKSALRRYKLSRQGWYKFQTALFVEMFEVDRFRGRLNDYFYLLRHVSHFRRRKLDRLALAILFLFRFY
ncbi:rhamnosyltransferase [Pseudomonas psychrotolerans]|nr:rhamnosyltransferase [Pseudomonas psychrotolerans]